MKYIKSFKFWLVFIVFFYSIFGFAFVPWFLTNKTASLLKEKIGLHVDIGKAKFNPFTFKLVVNDILLKDLDDKPVLGLKKVTIDYDILGLFHKDMLFKILKIDSPKLYVIIEKNSKLNFENILPASDKKPQEETSSSSSLAVVLQKLKITNGNISFSDMRKETPFTLKLGPYSFNAHDISTRKGDLNAHSFQTKIGKDGEIFWEGGMRVNPLSLYGEVKVDNLELPKLYAYAVTDLDAILKSGTLSIRLPYQVDFAKKVQTHINGANLTLTDIVFEDENPLVGINILQVNGFYLEWPKQNVVIDNFSIEGSKISTILDEKRILNLVSAFQSKNVQPQSTSKDNSKPWSFLLKTADISKTDITFTDKSLKKQFQAKLSDTSLHVKNISSQKTSPIEYEFSSVLNKNTNLKASGDIVQKPLSLSSNIDLKALHVTEFLNYITPFINFDIKSADVNLKAEINATLEDDIDFNLKASSTIKSLLLNTKDGKKLASWKELEVNNINYAHKKSSLDIQNVKLNKPYVSAYLNKNGSTNFSDLIIKSKDTKKTKTKAKPFNYKIKDVVIKEANILFKDKTLDASVKSELLKTSLHVKNISSNTKLPIEFKISSVLNKNTKLNLAGNVIQKPLTISSKVGIKNLHLSHYVEYLKPYINFEIKNADIDLKADIKAKIGKKVSLNLKADTKIKKLYINGSNGKKLLTWKQLSINGIKYAHNPMSLGIKNLTLDEPYIKAHINKDRSTNFSNLTKETKSAKRDEKSSPMKIKIGPMKLVNGKTDFSDASLPFPFITHIHDLNGHFSTLNFQTTTPSPLSLTGKIDKFGYANITGMLSPLNIKDNANLNILLKNIDLNSLTPYSGKFVGYKIKSGKLSMDLKYNIKKAKLVGDNKINIDTLTLGDTVESEDAVSLPLGLAIALLKDSKGQIDIDMPVAGDMDNPEFSYGSVIWGAVGNMITGIVTAPFRFLGSMLGVDGDELKSIDFDKGTSNIITTEHEKLGNLQKILAKRPAIKLTVIGGYDEVYDVQAMQKQKFIAIVTKELKKVKVDKNATKTDTYGIVLKKLYAKKFTLKKYEKKKASMLVDKKGKKIKLDLVTFNTILQNELIKEIKVSKEELISLANKRANNIKTTLVEQYKIDKTRVTIATPKLVEPKRDRWIASELEIAI